MLPSETQPVRALERGRWICCASFQTYRRTPARFEVKQSVREWRDDRQTCCVASWNEVSR